ncbi:MAG: hypothetical protein HRT35_26300, partial [Algicola sp.]|nr:hypothetical protein [Algicola sp.]
QAHAYAQGSDIHLSAGQEKHLPHELGHVVQQMKGQVKPTRQLKSKVAINDDPRLEADATRLGEKALQLAGAGVSTTAHNGNRLLVPDYSFTGQTVQMKTLKMAGLDTGLTEHPHVALKSTSLGPKVGHPYTDTTPVASQADKKTALIKAAELNGALGARYHGHDLQNSTDVRSKSLGAGASLQDTLGSKLAGELRKNMLAIPNILTSTQAVADPLMKAEIVKQAPVHASHLTKLTAAIITKFNFDWDQLYKAEHSAKITIATPKSDKTFNAKTINTAANIQEYTANNLVGLKSKLTADFPAVDSATVNGVTVNSITNIAVSTDPGFKLAFEGKINTAVTTDQLLDLNDISLIDPFVYTCDVPFATNIMSLDFQHAEDWPGYVTKVKEIHGVIDAEMQTTHILNPTKKGIADKYSNVHGDTGGTVLTGNLDVVATDTREDNEKKIDSHTKIAGEGARFKCVRDSATAGSLTNDTYFYTDELGTNGVVNPGIRFSDLWKAWSSEFDKKYDIGNKKIKDRLKDCDKGEFQLMSGKIKVQAKSDGQPHHHKL